MRATEFFDEPEQNALKATFAATTATADLLARQRVRERLEKVKAKDDGSLFSERRYFDESGVPPLMQPERALEYFRKLTPTLGVDPQRWGDQMRRHAFNLAVDTEIVVLEKVQKIIADRLATGVGIAIAPAEIEEILELVGVATRSPQYSEMIFRTNYMDSIQTAIDEEKSDPEVSEYFPAWRYSNPEDSRSRPQHAARNGLYYPASVPFAEVRGTDISDVANCRCDQIMIDKFEWQELREKGANFARVA